MRTWWMTALLLATLAGCAQEPTSQRYTVFFQSYSVEPDSTARDTIHAAADFARGHPALPIMVAGYAAPPDHPSSKDVVEDLSQPRAVVVEKMLIAEGIGAGRISTAAHGIVDPNMLPYVAVRRVDIRIGAGGT